MLRVPEIEIFRVLSNLIKNSFEANAAEVNLDFFLDQSLLKIDVKDNGDGIPSDLMLMVRNGFTTKSDGNGLGLLSVQKIVQKAGGIFNIASSLGKGTVIHMTIPIVEDIVLIDDDKYIHQNWLLKARLANLNLHSFKSIESFLEKSANINKDALVFVDVDLGQSQRGDFESKKIFDSGFQEVNLATGFPESDFNRATFYWVKSVISKSRLFNGVHYKGCQLPFGKKLG